MADRDPGAHPNAGLFGTAGWLFADLMLALVMLFLVASTVGLYVPPPSQATPTPMPTATVLPVLALQPVTLMLAVDYSGLLKQDPAAIVSAQQQVKADPRIQGKRAGLVLTFGGAVGDQRDLALRIAEAIDTTVLSGLGQQGFVFRGTVYREFLDLDNPPTKVQIDVYVFK